MNVSKIEEANKKNIPECLEPPLLHWLVKNTWHRPLQALRWLSLALIGLCGVSRASLVCVGLWWYYRGSHTHVGVASGKIILQHSFLAIYVQYLVYLV